MTEKDKKAFHSFFNPSSIAVIGASENPFAFGTQYLDTLLKFGYPGKIYAINPNGGQSLGIKMHKNIVDVPEKVDLAVVTVPPQVVLSVLEDCLKKDIQSAIVLSSGFSESGERGRVLEEELAKITKKGIRILGPNCFGVYCPQGGLSVISGSMFPKESGGTSLLAQSGQFTEMIVKRSIGEGIRFSKAISFGNACDINESDLLEYLGQDQETKVILVYLEGVKNGKRFLDAVRRESIRKPIIIWKAGLTHLGSAAASSHTGSLAGENVIWNAFFHLPRVIHVESDEELIDAALAFNCWPNGCGSRVGLISGGGGGAVIGADACELEGLKMPDFSSDTKEKLSSVLPGAGTSVRNPLDIGNPLPSLKMLNVVADAVTADTQVDAVIIRRVFFSDRIRQIVLGQSTIPKSDQQELIDVPIKTKRKYGKPLALVLSEEMTGSDVLELEAERRKLRDYYFSNKILIYPTINRAVKAISHLAQYKEGLQIPYVDRANLTKISGVMRLPISCDNGGSQVLDEVKSKELLKKAGVEVVDTRLAKTKEEALSISAEIGLPVAMKIISPQIIHKSDSGGVKLGLRTTKQIALSYDNMLNNVIQKNPTAEIKGISIQKMLTPGIELVVGMSRDPQFGPVLMFGLGGIFIEILKDVSFGFVPLNRREARDMINGIKGYKLLEGYRGKEPINISVLEDLLLRISDFIESNPEIKEMDINPLFAYPDKVIAVDARIVVDLIHNK